MKKGYISEVYNAGQTVLFTSIFIVLFIALSMAIGVYLKSPIIGVGGFILTCIFPFLFEKKIKRRWFIKKYLLEFDDLTISVSKYYSMSSDIVSKQTNIKWIDIKSYKFYFGSLKTTILTIYLKDGGHKLWSFKDDKTFQEAIEEESVFTTFRTYVKQYNSDKDNDDKIVLNKGILNTTAGTVIIYSEIAILIFGFVFHLIMAPQTSFLTLFIGAGLVSQLFIKRKQDKKWYDEISKL